MVNVGKREDGLIDWANAKDKKVKAALLMIDTYERSARTATETEILNTLKGILSE